MSQTNKPANTNNKTDTTPSYNKENVQQVLLSLGKVKNTKIAGKKKSSSASTLGSGSTKKLLSTGIHSKKTVTDNAPLMNSAENSKNRKKLLVPPPPRPKSSKNSTPLVHYNGPYCSAKHNSQQSIKIKIKLQKEFPLSTTYDRFSNIVQQAIMKRFLKMNQRFTSSHYQFVNVDPVGQVSAGVVSHIGRICCDSAQNQKLNEKSILLEGFGDEEETKSFITKLNNLHGLNQHVSLFPGQIVGVRGKSITNGKEFFVSEIFAKAPCEIDYDVKGDKTLENGLKIMIAAGPYSFDTDWNYQPLRQLIDIAKARKPNILVLMGPFVDSNHKDIDNCMETYDEVFERLIGELSVLESENLEIIVVPSLRDITHDFVYPQAPFESSRFRKLWSKGAESKLHFVPNPCIVKFNGICFGFTSQPIVPLIASLEYSNRLLDHQERIAKITEHIVNQNSFYPLSFGYDNVPFDYANSEYLEFDKSPLFLVLPSELSPSFDKLHNGTVAINPGYSANDNSNSGSYAVIDIHPSRPEHKNTILKTSSEAYKNVVERTEVKILEI